MKYLLMHKQSLDNNILLITLRPKGRQQLSFVAGQYASISFLSPRTSPARCFSILNSPNSNGILQFGIKVGGDYTQTLSQLPLGTLFDIKGGFGSFTLDPASDKTTVMLAGGIGVTPMISIIRDATSRKLTNKITLLYSVSRQDSVPFAEQLLELERLNPNFKVIFVISNGSTSRFNSRQVLRGRTNLSMISRIAQNDFTDTTFFICGPADYMRTIQSMLSTQAVPVPRIQLESFNRKVTGTKSRKSFAPLRIFSVYGFSVVLFVALVTSLILSTHQPQPNIAQTTLSSQSVQQTAPASATPNATKTYTSTSAPSSGSTAPSPTTTYRAPVSAVS